MKVKIQPIGNTLLVEAVKISTTLQLPSTVDAEKYVILAVGDGDKIPKTIKVGDTVILQDSYSGVPIKDTNYKLINSELVLEKVTE